MGKNKKISYKSPGENECYYRIQIKDEEQQYNMPSCWI